MTRLIIIAAVLAFTAVLHVGAQGTNRKPVRETVSATHYKPVPETPEALYEASDAVLVVKVIGLRSIAKPSTPWRPIETEIRSKIISVVKSGPGVTPPGSETVFRIPGGELDRGDYIERYVESTQPPLHPGRTYLVALQWSPDEGAMYSLRGPSTTFDVTDGKVMAQDQGSLLAERNRGANVEDFIANMKKSGGRP